MRKSSGIMLILILTSMLVLKFNFQSANAGSSTQANRVTGTTYVEGNITVDTTWTVAGSPYVITGNVLVVKGVTLTIEPGVIVKVNLAKAIQVDGQLIARGTETEPILFTSNHPSPAAGYWAGIKFTDSSIDASYDEAGNYLNGSIMQFCTIEYGGGDSPPLKIESASPFISNCVIRNNNSPGIYVANGSPKIVHSIITHNSISKQSEDGGRIYLYGGGIFISGDGAVISDNVITYNSIKAIGSYGDGYAYGGGIYATGRILIINNNVSWNSATGSIYVSGGGSAYGGGIYASGEVIISNNTIANNNVEGSYGNSDGGGIYALGAVTISNNTIANNSVSGYVINAHGGGIFASGRVTMGSNIILHNSIKADVSGHGGDAYGGGIYANGDGIVISGNSVFSNLATDVPHGYSYRLGGGICAIGNGINITGNFVIDNVVFGKGGGIYASGQATIINENVIIRNYAKLPSQYFCDVRGGGIYASNTVTVSNNKVVSNFAEHKGGGIYGGNINYNTVVNNSATTGGGIAGSSTIFYNTIIDNKGNGIETNGFESINYNNIYNNTPYDIYNAGGNDVNATNNWWNTTIDSQIQEKIYDWFDDATRGIVNYIPYLPTPETEAPISPPTSLSATTEDLVINLTWSPNPEADVAGYKVYYDTDSGYPYNGIGANEGSSGIDVGNVTNYQLSGLMGGTTYYITITAYDHSGDESWYSKEVSVIIPDFSITASPDWLVIRQGCSETSIIIITSIGGFNQPVQLTVSGLPDWLTPYITIALNPEQVTTIPNGVVTSTLTVSVSGGATPGSYTLIVTGISNALSHSVNISLEIETLPFPHVYNVTWEGINYPVIILSNSNITLFIFNQSSAQITFEVSGKSGVSGYCNVTIPKALLKGGPWTVKLNGTVWEYSLLENQTHSFIYFTYTFESTYEVVIQGTWVIPEFSSIIILPIFVLTTLAITVVWKKKET
jgi:hypothetical protein